MLLMLSLPPASNPVGDGREPDTRSSCRLLLAWGVLLPGKAKTLEWGVWGRLTGWFIFWGSI